AKFPPVTQPMGARPREGSDREDNGAPRPVYCTLRNDRSDNQAITTTSAQSYREDTMKRPLLLGAALALAFGAGIAAQSIVGAQTPTPPVDVIKEEPLVGGTSDNMIMQVVTLGPNAASPWHIHPDGHEISYVLEGAVKVEIDKKGGQVYKA